MCWPGEQSPGPQRLGSGGADRRCSQSPRLPWGRTVGEPCLGITPCRAPTLAKLCKVRAKPLTLTIRAPSPALPRYHECLLG